MKRRPCEKPDITKAIGGEIAETIAEKRRGAVERVKQCFIDQLKAELPLEDVEEDLAGWEKDHQDQLAKRIVDVLLPEGTA